MFKFEHGPIDSLNTDGTDVWAQKSLGPDQVLVLVNGKEDIPLH
jgi:hypothetical protein